MPIPAIFIRAMHLISPAGDGAEDLWQAIAAGQSCVREYEDAALSKVPFFASRLQPEQWDMIRTRAGQKSWTDFERLAWYSASAALAKAGGPISKTAFILSTTKGSIAQLGVLPDERIALHQSAKIISEALGLSGNSFVVSQACISGLAAILYGVRLLEGGRFEQVVVTGADVVSRFVLSGFQSFHAIDKAPCRPFDLNRKGINLGEAAATVVLSRKEAGALARVAGGAISNDANHISGPSRTGQELALAINRGLQAAGIKAGDIAAISAHGTATVYNDEMESKAFALCGLLQAPLHSVKGATGHTLGAAGVLESVMVAACLQRQATLPSVGFQDLGVPEPVTVSRQLTPLPLNYMLKTASGFGGSNAAVVFERC